MTPAETLGHLSELLDREHEKPVNNKYHAARDFTAKLLKLPSSRIYFTYISKAANFSVRAVQSDAAVQASVVVALIKLRGKDEDAATHRAARKLALRTGKTLLLLQRASPDSLQWNIMGGYFMSADLRSKGVVDGLVNNFGPIPFEPINVSTDEAVSGVLDFFDRVGLSGAGVGVALSQRQDISSIVQFAAASSAAGLSAAETAVIARRRTLIAELKHMIADPATTETDLHRKIRGNYWIFGGRYTGVARGSIVPMDRYDIPLFCADGSLHIIELKGSYIPDLVERHRQHLIPGEEVHKATMQAANYIRQLDEGGAALETLYRNSGLNYDLRRGRATVIIGNQDFVDIPADPVRQVGAVTRSMIDQTIRTYDSLINRIDVLTWADLLDSAERSLRFESEISTDHASTEDKPGSSTGYQCGEEPDNGENPTLFD
ncbi:Shedu anti-phage system protein SduA domain-containing protein [Streptomyces sp. NPDC049951]|uniref:Shedu anti-phage system protein SduA domain-containing protein n=1 Tax=Streptomyces sp. NPDC049951 TaxID=3156660 RepID=UPI00344922D2